MIARAKVTELLIGALTLVLSTVGFLIGSFAVAVIGLVAGGVSFGLLLGADRPED